MIDPAARDDQPAGFAALGHRVWIHLRRDYVALGGLALLAAVVCAAMFAPAIPIFDPIRPDTESLLRPPSWRHPLGTDQLGRDILSRVLHGARTSLLVALGSVALASIAGITLGVAAGYSGGLADEIIMRAMDLLMAFPAILLALTIVTVLGHSTGSLVTALGIVYAPRFARVARVSTLGTSVEAFVEAARSLGASQLWLIRHHILPNIVAPMLIVATVTLASAVVAEAGLSFLGLGVQPPYPSWGRMLSEGKPYLEIAPGLTIFPGLAVVCTVLSFNLVGDSLRDALDPRLRR